MLELNIMGSFSEHNLKTSIEGPGMAVDDCNCIPRETEQEDCSNKASLVYIASFKPAGIV